MTLAGTPPRKLETRLARPSPKKSAPSTSAVHRPPATTAVEEECDGAGVGGAGVGGAGVGGGVLHAVSSHAVHWQCHTRCATHLL